MPPRDIELSIDGAVLRLRSVVQVTGLCRSTIYKLVAEKGFPSPVHLTKRAVGWHQKEVEQWLQARPLLPGCRTRRDDVDPSRTTVRHKGLVTQYSETMGEPAPCAARSLPELMPPSRSSAPICRTSRKDKPLADTNLAKSRNSRIFVTTK
jgi:prophage regulatory protein